MDAMISAAQPEAAEAGAVVLERGGNAIDAAVACAFVQGVVDPLMAGLGGFGTMQIYMPKRDIHVAIDFSARAPLAVTPTMWLSKLRGLAPDGFAFLLENDLNEIGYQSIGTPGTLKGMSEALDAYGSISLADALAPAIEVAQRGYMVRPYAYYHWTLDQKDEGRVDSIHKLRFSETGRRLFFRDGEVKRPGDSIVNPELATTMERIARGGPELFYEGELAEEMIDDIRAQGGILTLDDFKTFDTTKSEPVWGDYRGQRIASSTPPAGGCGLIQLLHILENFDLRSLRHNSVEHITLLAEAMRWTTIDRDQYLGDPAFVDVPIERFLSKSRAAEIAENIRSGERAVIERGVTRELKESQDTTQVNVVDKEGNAVSITHTIGNPSGVISPGLGFMYNGCMVRFDPRPGKAGSLAPRKTRTNSQSPTMVFKDDRLHLVLGAPGGIHIMPTVAQGIMNVIDFDMPILDAVIAPRISATSNVIEVSNRIQHRVTAALERNGYRTKRTYLNYAFAALHAIQCSDGRVTGGADPQRDGMVLRVE